MNSFSQFKKNPKQTNKQTNKKERKQQQQQQQQNNNRKTSYWICKDCTCRLWKDHVQNPEFLINIFSKLPWQVATLFCSSNYLLDVYLRVRPYERRNELKPIWDFISVENIQFGVQSALYLCSHECSMKLKPVWISYRSFWPKWNFKQTWDFHVNKIYPKRNE